MADARRFLNNLPFDERDLSAGATLHDLSSLIKSIKSVKNLSNRMEKMLDLGCGYGGLTKFVADYLRIPEVHGVDIDEERLKVAKERGIKTHKVDISRGKLPFPNGYFDLVTSFGVIEHLTYYDPLLQETQRVLRKGGIFILSMPNLGSYVNRFALLLGFQPRDVEISKKRAFGSLPMYKGLYIGHVRSATLKAMVEMLEAYRFAVQNVFPLNPNYDNLFIRIGDKIFGRFPSLARRFIIISRKL